jgi:hypothetical protein
MAHLVVAALTHNLQFLSDYLVRPTILLLAQWVEQTTLDSILGAEIQSSKIAKPRRRFQFMPYGYI